MGKLILRVGIGLALLYGGLCLLIFVFQRDLLYFPDRALESDALRRAEGLAFRPWRDRAEHVIGWRPMRQHPAPMRVLLFQGNAGNALDRAAYLQRFDPARFELVLMEYPGYGMRSGSPSEQSLVNAGLEAFDLLRQEGPVLLLGESLGSGVAVQVAASRREQVSGLALLTPYARMTEVGATHYPWFPVNGLLKDRWDSLSPISSFHGPVAILVAGRDEVVGADQGRRLAAACPQAKVWELPEAGHNGLDLRPGRWPWSAMLEHLCPAL